MQPMDHSDCTDTKKELTLSVITKPLDLSDIMIVWFRSKWNTTRLLVLTYC